MRFRKISIIGVGLLGGSLGLAVRKRGLADRVVGFVRRAASVEECARVGAVDHATLDLAEAIDGADLVVLCTPLYQMSSLVEKMLPLLKRGAVVTDVGSVKASVVRELERRIGRIRAHFIGSHPMAGAEKTGVSAARAELFVNAVCVVTPTPRSNPAALRKVSEFWKAVGGRLLRLAPDAHDALVSRSSHLPHVTAVTLANLVLDPAQSKYQAELCANGFRDTTRIASGSPEMWRDIALANRRNLGRAIDHYIRDLQKFRKALRNADGLALAAMLQQAKDLRDAWCAGCASPSPE